ncbi:MAG: hypothetical protein WDN31_14770 [Hyphomicrobium sp.]
MLAAPSAYAACKQGYCMTGSWDGSARRVDFTTSLRGTHFNVNNGQQQIELGRNVRSFVVYPTSSKPLQFRYAIQTCNKGGPFSKSSCSPWVNFTHTEK